MATIAPIFTSTRVPYGVNRFDRAPTRIWAEATPDTATSTKQPSAMLEYRATTTARRSPGSTPRRSTSMVRPPTQSAAPTRCSPSAVTAASWLAVPAAWPCCASGMRPIIETAAVRATIPRERTAKQSTVTAAATSTVTSQARPRSVPVRNTPIDWPNCSSMLISEPATLRKVKKVVTADDTVQMPLAAAATSMARFHSGPDRESPTVASARPPIVAAADRSTTSREIGSPKRTRGPGSAISAAFAPPPMTSAVSSATNPTSRSTAGPAMRAIRFTRQA